MIARALLFAVLALVAACAGSRALDRSAEQHDVAARAYESQDRYDDALREREAADADREARARFDRHDGDEVPRPMGVGR